MRGVLAVLWLDLFWLGAITQDEGIVLSQLHSTSRSIQSLMGQLFSTLLSVLGGESSGPL